MYGVCFDNGSNIAYWDGNLEVNLENTTARYRVFVGLTGIAASGNDVYVTGLAFAQRPGIPATLAIVPFIGRIVISFISAIMRYGGVYHHPSTSGLALSETICMWQAISISMPIRWLGAVTGRTVLRSVCQTGAGIIMRRRMRLRFPETMYMWLG